MQHYLDVSYLFTWDEIKNVLFAYQSEVLESMKLPEGSCNAEEWAVKSGKVAAVADILKRLRAFKEDNPPSVAEQEDDYDHPFIGGGDR